MTDQLTRRGFLAASGATLAAAWLGADAKDVHASLAHAAKAASGPPPPWQVLTPEQAADIEAITAQVIPTDDLPGAREARVVNFIDHSLATWAADQRDPLLTGLEGFNQEVAKQLPGTKRFAELTAERQLEFLRANETSDFFQQVRAATIAGMFSLPSYGGNYDKAGWRILGFEDRFAWQPPFGAYDAEPGQ